jgi:hypothetical protein
MGTTAITGCTDHESHLVVHSIFRLILRLDGANKITLPSVNTSITEIVCNFTSGKVMLTCVTANSAPFKSGRMYVKGNADIKLRFVWI